MKRFAAAASLGALLMLAPVSTQAADLEQRDSITITRDQQFDRAHGVRSGRGTVKDPFVISGWELHSLTIADTTKAVRIVGNNVHGTMTLNWIGSNVLVRDNHVSDLRVNENVERWGAPTSGMIMHNHFDRVSQIRHFDGMFMRNVVGHAQESVVPFFNRTVVNFDGFNGAHFAYNTVYGAVDAQLHGHHHSSKYGSASHMHSAENHGMVDHTRRFHEVFIHHNRIANDGSYALAYRDTGHVANDRTAASETNPNLEAPHVHYTRVHLNDNVLVGSGILVEVFNARDENHYSTARGLVEIAGNRISLARSEMPFSWATGIDVQQARALVLKIDRNTITAPAAEQTEEPLRTWEIQGAGISLGDIDGAVVSLSRDRVTNLLSGISASRMSHSVIWTIDRLSTSGVPNPVSYDESVKNKPKRR